MIDHLRDLYDTELEYFRSLSGEFAERYPKIAGRLGVDSTGVRDPHAERFIQAAALLNARTRHQLDDDFPELVEGLLDILYPHVLRPVPSAALVKFELDASKGASTTGYPVPDGTLLECSGPKGATLTYRTCGETTLWPIDIKECYFENQPLEGPSPATASSRLVLKIDPLSSAVVLSSLAAESIRFGIVLPQLPAAGRLLEMLIEHCVGVHWSDGHKTSFPVHGSPKVAGFDDRTAVLPGDARSFSGYRLLTELFVCPEKFLMFEVEHPFRELPENPPADLRLEFFFDREDRELDRLVNNTTIQTGVAPIVNLFRRTAANLPIDHRRAEIRVVPDSRNEDSVEVFSIDHVAGIRDDGSQLPTQAFFQHRIDERLSTRGTYWYATRRPRAVGQENSSTISIDADETYLSLVDFSHESRISEIEGAYVRATCFNRDLPSALASGGRLPQFRASDANASLEITTLTRPTPTWRWGDRSKSRWRWLAHVSLGALPLSQGASGPSTLQQLLGLYSPLSNESSGGIIDGIESFDCRSDLAYLPGVPGGFCRGVEVNLGLDEERFVGHSPYLLASALDEFLSRYVSVNSFVRLKASTASMRKRGEQWEWSPRAGKRSLL